MGISRRWRLITLLAVPVLLVAAMLVSQWQVPVQAQDGGTEMTKRTISVNGNGEITVEPDAAYVNLGVLTKGKTAEEAQQENAKVFGQLNNVLFEQFKIEDKDVKTVSFQVFPEYRYQEGQEPVITGYTATHTIQITYRDLDRIGELLDAATKAGVNQVNNVQFITEKSEAYELEAMKLAMENARRKAEVLAAAEGQKLKGVIQIVQQGAGNVVYSSRDMSGVAYNLAEAAVKTTVNPGEITISSSVTVVYEF